MAAAAEAEAAEATSLVSVVEGVGVADKSNARESACGAPSLCVALKGVAILALDSRARIEQRLLGGRKSRKVPAHVPARYVDLDATRDLDRSRMLFDWSAEVAFHLSGE